jgi:hypothetical protein
MLRLHSDDLRIESRGVRPRLIALSAGLVPIREREGVASRLVVALLEQSGQLAGQLLTLELDLGQLRIEALQVLPAVPARAHPEDRASFVSGQLSDHLLTHGRRRELLNLLPLARRLSGGLLGDPGCRDRDVRCLAGFTKCLVGLHWFVSSRSGPPRARNRSTAPTRMRIGAFDPLPSWTASSSPAPIRR